MKYYKGDIIKSTQRQNDPLVYVIYAYSHHYFLQIDDWYSIDPSDYVEKYYILVTDIFREEE